MSSLNEVTLLGNLGQDVELFHTTKGQPVTRLSVATNQFWNQDGQKQQRTDWHRVVVWGKQAENCSKFLSKGRQVMVQGRLQTRQWTDGEGNTRYTTEVVARNVQFLGGSRQDAKVTQSTDQQEDLPLQEEEVTAAQLLQQVQDGDAQF